jgi:hypothetical protein
MLRGETKPLEVEQKEIFEFRLYQARILAKKHGFHPADWLLAEIGHDPVRIAHLVGAPDQRLPDVIERYRRFIYREVEKSRSDLTRREFTETQCKSIVSRLRKAKETRESFDKFVNDLYDAPQKLGWMWRDEKAVDSIAERFPDYKAGAIREYVKLIKAKYRNAWK